MGSKDLVRLNVNTLFGRRAMAYKRKPHVSGKPNKFDQIIAVRLLVPSLLAL